MIQGLTVKEAEMLQALVRTLTAYSAKNAIKDRYYEGAIPLREVNLGIALPDELRKLEVGCTWGSKTVDVLAARSIFDGFVGLNGEDLTELDALVKANHLVSEYKKTCKDELKLGCSFATLSKDPKIGCKIRFHSAQTASALWDGDKGRIKCGLAIIDTAPTNDASKTWSPSLLNMYTNDAVIVLSRAGSRWTAERYPHKMGRPLMEPLVWGATSAKPFGRSRIKDPIRRLIQGYVRTIANASIGLEFATSPQKYLLGVTDEQYDALINDKFRQYVGSIIASTVNPETGEKPSFGQLSQGTIQPHAEMLRMLSAQFSAATGLTVSDTGVVSDANPTSSDAILAQSQTLVGMAEELNAGNGDALVTIAQMALAIIHNVSLDELTEEQRAIVAHFRNPSMPSIAMTADAAVKIASVRTSFAQTDVFLEMLGFSQADIRRVRAQEQKARGLAVLEELSLDDIAE